MARRGRKPKRRVQIERYKGLILSAVSLSLLLLSVLSLLSIFAGVGDSAGSVNSKLRETLVDGFGFASILIPIILFYLGLLIIGTIRWKFLNYRIFIGFLLLFTGLLGLFGDMGSGTFGGILQSKTVVYISSLGAMFLYLIMIIFSFVVITNVGIDILIAKIYGAVKFIQTKVFRFMPNQPEMVDVQPATDDQDTPQLEMGGEDGQVLDQEEMSFDSPKVTISGVVEKEKDKSLEIIDPPTTPVEDNGEDENVPKGSSADARPREEKKESTLPFSNKVWEYPSLSLLSDVPNQPPDAGNIQERANVIEETLKSFGVKAAMTDVHIGPAFTRYALTPALGTKTSKIQALSTDLALRLKSPSGSVRIDAPIPGTNLVGIEVPNFSPSTVSLKSVLESDDIKRSKPKLTVAIGHDVSGKPVIQNIGHWPHALIAGATGTGKSVMLNALISAILFRCSPSECRFIMIDPKLVELSQFNGIPHLLTPVVTDIGQKAVSALAWAVSEMERRYQLFASAGVRNLDAYNKKSGFQAEPYIVIVVDEIADMMMIAASEVEKYIIRLAQKSRATGIHLILATQRPSVNILTGTIKANIPTRFAFKVTSQVDSRVIIDQAGAETLIGRGDMLFVPPEDSKPRRVQGALIRDEEIKSLVDYLRNVGVEPDYKEEVLQQKVVSASKATGKLKGDMDVKMVDALELAISDGKVSASYLQRKLGVGYSRAARMIDDMEDAGIIGPARGSKPREVLTVGVDEAVAKLGALKEG